MLRAVVVAVVAVLALAWAAPASAQEPRFRILLFSEADFEHDGTAAAIDAVEALAAEHGFAVDATEDSSAFTEGNLARYDAVVFNSTNGDPLTGPQQIAFERYIQAGGGYVGLHSASNSDQDWAWYGDMLGEGRFDTHPAGAAQFQDATVVREDADHPSTVTLPERWTREDEWYNTRRNPRAAGVHVLLTLDEGTYDEQDGSPEADDHPIAWCSNYDGGRAWYTALGHKAEYWSEPLLRAHVLGGIEWAAGAEPGDCGPEREGIPSDSSFEKVPLDDDSRNPMELDVAPDGRVFIAEFNGRVKIYEPESHAIVTAATLEVNNAQENGLVGLTLDPDFADNGWIYLFYAAPDEVELRVSRFTVTGDELDLGSERILLEIPHQREICCHTAGSLTFGPEGNLFISTGDDTAWYASDGYAPIDDRLHTGEAQTPDGRRAFDARRTSGNTNDLRGKILRITPKDDGTYTIPPGNLFPPFTSDPEKTRPEIYTMGHRNPFRITVDSETGWLYNGEVGPDASNDDPSRGPRGYDELNQIREAGNMGWPYCIADNKPYRDFDFATGTPGPPFDCEGGPTNDSAFNTGLTQLPPAEPADVFYPYAPSPDFPVRDYPGLRNGGGRTAMAGAVYHHDPDNPSETKFPAFYDDAVFWMDWSRRWIAFSRLDEQGRIETIEPFMPSTEFIRPHDMDFGPDGSMYLIEWGSQISYAPGQSSSSDSGVYRIDFVKGSRTPIVRADADRTSGPTPLTVAFTSEGTHDLDGDELTYEWDFGDGSPHSSEPNPTHVYTEAGTFTARLTVTDATGKAAASSVTISAGNSRPAVRLEVPAEGGFFEWGDEIAYRVAVEDAEDGAIDCDRVRVMAGVFHDEGGNAHVHPGSQATGCEGTIATPPTSGHDASAKVTQTLEASYTDGGGEPGSDPLTGSTIAYLNPKRLEAEHYSGHTGTQINTVANAEGGRTVGYADQGEHIYFEPVSLENVEELTIRYAAGFEGGVVDVRTGAADGPVVGTATLMPTGSWTAFRDITIPLEASEASGRLYFTFRGRPGQRTTDLFDLDRFTFHGKGMAVNAAPAVAATATPAVGEVPLPVAFDGEASDPEGAELTYAWDFTSDGTVDATTADAAHVYATAGRHEATLTVTDAGGRTATETIVVQVLAPSACFGPGSDGFDGTELDRSIWTATVREDPATYTVADGSLRLPALHGDFFAGATTSPNLILQPAPDGDYTATTRVSFRPTENWHQAGLLIYGSDADYVRLDVIHSGGRKIELIKETGDAPAFPVEPQALPASFPDSFLLRLRVRGGSVQASYSDGSGWTELGPAVSLSGIETPRVGLWASDGNGSVTARPAAEFAWFALDGGPRPEASDEFDGDALDRCRWTTIVRETAGGHAVEDGALVLPTAPGDFWSNRTTSPNIVLQPAPEGAWTATTRVSFEPTQNYHQAGLVLYGNDQDYIRLDAIWIDGRKIEFLREIDDSPETIGAAAPLPPDLPSTFYLRLHSDGSVVRAYYSGDGREWTRFGGEAALAGIASPQIGLYANDGAGSVSERPDARFDWFRLTSGADTAAPITTTQLSPAAPDGRAGWYVSPVGVALAADDGAQGSGVVATEYRVGGGEWLPYEEAVLLADDGEHVIEARSTDHAGNVEAPRAVTVRIDRTAPATSHVQAPAGHGPHRGPVTLRLEAADATSGVAATEYRVDGGGWTPYTGPVTISEPGDHVVRYRSRDAAGNVEEAHQVGIAISVPAGGGPSDGDDGGGGTPGGGEDEGGGSPGGGDQGGGTPRGGGDDAGGGSPGGDAPAPKPRPARLGRVSRRSLRALVRRGLRVKLRCEAGGRAVGRLRVGRRAARRLGLRSRTLARDTARCAEGRTVRLRLRARRPARHDLRDRRRRLRTRLSVRVRAADGGSRRLTRKVVLRGMPHGGKRR